MRLKRKKLDYDLREVKAQFENHVSLVRPSSIDGGQIFTNIIEKKLRSSFPGGLGLEEPAENMKFVKL